MIALVDLADKADARIRTLSGGQRRRLDLALALVGDPELLFLDEPTTGFDPQARRHAWDLVKRLCKLGKTIFLTTHYMEEAQYLADRVAVICGGAPRRARRAGLDRRPRHGRRPDPLHAPRPRADVRSCRWPRAWTMAASLIETADVDGRSCTR